MNSISRPDKRCPHCGETKSLDAFHLRNKKTGAPHSWCKTCSVAMLHVKMQRRRELRTMLGEIKLSRGCADCGYRDRPEKLHFDHLPGAEKRGNVSNVLKFASIELLMLEVAKCEVVCWACHGRRTAARRQSNDTTSRFSGIYWDRYRLRWRAAVRLNGKKYCLGSYLNEDEAGAVVEAWRAKHMPFAAD